MSELLPHHVRGHLLAYARETLAAITAGREPSAPPEGGVFDTPAAVFVTLRHGDELRGCVGCTRAERPLGSVVAEMTRDAAAEDPRFPPVTPREVPEIRIEISRLTTPVAATKDDVVPGRHGVIVRSGPQIGLLLPQVAVEFGCDAGEFLELACRKAGLPVHAWENDDVSLCVFEAEVFGE